MTPARGKDAVGESTICALDRVVPALRIASWLTADERCASWSAARYAQTVQRLFDAGPERGTTVGKPHQLVHQRQELTGQTTAGAVNLLQGVEQLVFEEKTVMVCSMTRAAANEIASRMSRFKSHVAVGTLHSHAFRTLDRPDIAESDSDEWNRHNKRYRFGVKHDRAGAHSEVPVPRTLGDRLYLEYSRQRAAVIPRDRWPRNVHGFAAAWEAWKDETGRLDFTDLIELARTPDPTPDVIVVDEAQDLSHLEFQLLRRWAESAEQLVLVGDPWQSLYTWRGAYYCGNFASCLYAFRVRLTVQRIVKSIYH